MADGEPFREGLDPVAVAGIVDRPRLYDVLDSPLVRMCVVQGPTGSGKTTLVRSWVLRRPRPGATVWVPLGPGVSSRHLFWQHVAITAARLGDLPPEAAAAVREQLSVAVDPVRIASRLLRDAGPVLLILDAYEHLGDAIPEVDADIAHLLGVAPELSVLVTTRVVTALADLRVPDGSLVRVITLRELALTPEEVGELIAQETGMVGDRLARSVVSATHGFALTVRAVVLALSQLGSIPHLDSVEWDAVVAARLESLLPGPEAIGFVTDTSVPPYVDLELAQSLSGDTDAAGMLDMLERNGFGRWIPYARGRPVFQYVETIRDTFRARATDDAERFRRSCLQTAFWLFANDDIDQALRFAIDGGDYALADRVFVQLVIGNPDSYITDRFLATLRDVPEEALSEYPMLAFGLGLALASNPLLRHEAPRVYRIAYESQAYPAYVEPAVDAFSHASMRAISRRCAFRFRESAAASQECLRMLDDMSPELLGTFGEHLGTIVRQLAYSLWQGGLTGEADRAIGRSVTLCTSAAARDYSLVYAAGIAGFAGDIVRAKAVLASIDARAWPDALRRTYMNAPGVIAEGYARLDALDFDGVLEVLGESESYMATAEFWPFLRALAVSARHGRGQAPAVAELVTAELAGPTPPGVGDNIATDRLCAVLAQAWMASGDRRAAARMLDGRPADSPCLAAARVTLLLGAWHEREALLRARALLALPGHTLRTRAETQTIGAAAALRQGETDQARAWLSAAAVAAEVHGPRAHVMWLTPRDRRLLWELGGDREGETLRRFLDVPSIDLPVPRSADIALTPREQVVLAALAEHDSIKAVAESLIVSPHTVKSQLQGIYRKLGVSSRRSALDVARDLGLVETADPRG